MTKRDYKHIAASLNRAYHAMSNPYLEEQGFNRAVGAVAIALKQDNPRFSYYSFTNAVYDDKERR